MVAMAGGGYSRLPGGEVVVALRLPWPGGPGGIGPEDGGNGSGRTEGAAAPHIRLIVVAANRQRALTRLRNLGFRTVRLAGNAEPPTHDEINAVLHHPDRLVWRRFPAAPADPWRSIATLLGPTVRR